MTKNRLVAFFALFVFITMTGGTAFAHHGYADAFDSSKEITLTGTVTKFNWANPHSQLYFDVTDSSGTVSHWAAEMSSPGVLQRRDEGWARNTLKPGDVVKVTIDPAKSGALVGNMSVVVLPDGRKLRGGTGGGGKAE